MLEPTNEANLSRSTTEHVEARLLRSFVRREGRLTPAQKKALEVLAPHYCLEPANGMPDLARSFETPAPLHLEIGCGIGESLLNLAALNPGNNYCATEVYRPGIGSLLQKLVQHQLRNVRIVLQDAVVCLNDAIADQSLSAVYIFFPDPWPKKRHHKRRLIQGEFARRLLRKLRRDGCVFLATDAEDYAHQMLSVLEANGYENLAGPGRFAPRPHWRPLTRYEARGLRLGHTIFDLVFTPQRA